VLDGWGMSPITFGNAIHAASKPVWDGLWAAWPHAELEAAGEAVGLPAGQQGNSEVGHLNLGGGRVVFQPILRISRAIADGTFFTNPVLRETVRQARAPGRRLHLLGLVSHGGVHSISAHLFALLHLARAEGVAEVLVHAFTDGRDEPPTSAAGYLAELQEQIRALGVGRIATVSGRYYAMDRDQRWERLEKAYRAIVEGDAPRAPDPVRFVEEAYARGVTDEFLPPTCIVPDGAAPMPMRDGDALICFNFRPDRMRQLTHALVDADWDHFRRAHPPKGLQVATMTEYEKGLPVRAAYPGEQLDGTLAAVLAAHGARQFHCAETEKYAHVTYFFNGGHEPPFPGEDRLLIPSSTVATYDLQPAMRAPEITTAMVDRIAHGRDLFLLANFANADMVGHTGNFTATVQAVEAVDQCLGQIAEAVRARGGSLLVTADHGNAEAKIDPRDNTPLTAHTTNPVPLLCVSPAASGLRSTGKLGDVAPTILHLLGIPVPRLMTGENLLR
jgi:2,3-bisphosphoglycerate-independent phosphoglycerate mutase